MKKFFQAFLKWPDAKSLISANFEEIEKTIFTLRFKNRRTRKLLDMSNAYIQKSWNDPRELPGIGNYAFGAWEIFCNNKLGNHPSNDGALKLYWNWRKKHEC